MKTEFNILLAFILNLTFSIFEMIGGVMTNSVAIISDAIHDFGDAISIGISYFLERKSKKQPDDVYTYGYARYSVLGSVITTVILLLGSIAVIYNSIGRLIAPAEINYNGMIILAIFGVFVNSCAAFFTHGGESLNQKAVNLHMLEDVLGWIVVLIGAVIIRFTNISIIDPLMSIGVSAFILFNAIKNLKEALDLFLEKIPHGIDIHEIFDEVRKVDGVLDVHHIHVWSMDGSINYATMHVVTDEDDTHEIKHRVKDKLWEHGIEHVTLEIEDEDERCHERKCVVEKHKCSCGHHHHHH